MTPFWGKNNSHFQNQTINFFLIQNRHILINPSVKFYTQEREIVT